jgi:DHA1 family multidrug resistance protein-like MFS transporter
LLGFLALAFLPIPFLFYVYGEILRKHSSYAPTDFFKKAEDEESKGSDTDRSKSE